MTALQRRINDYTEGLSDPADLDGDGVVTTKDLALLQRLIKTSSSGPADVNLDGTVNCADFSLVKAGLWKRAGQDGFNPEVDLVSDGVIDARDLAFVSQRLPARALCR